MKRMLPIYLSVSFLLLSFSGYSQNRTQFAVRNVNVITMTSPNNVINNATILITGNLIETINGGIPKNAKVIDGKGMWLIPGLVDMHVHLPTDAYFSKKLPAMAPDFTFNLQDIMTPIIANGVTTVLDLEAKMETFGQKKQIDNGTVIGPRIALAALINGGAGQGRVANTAEEGRFAVAMAKAEGYDFIKLYSNLNIETFNAIIDEANKRGIKTIGHIPNSFRDKLEKAFVPNFGMVAHAEEFSKHSEKFDIQDAKRFAKLAKDNGTWLTPTLTAMVWIAKQTQSIDDIKKSTSLQYVHPLLQSKWLNANNYVKNATPERAVHFDSMVEFHFQLVKAFKEAGVPIVAGTDAGVSGVVAGFSLHDEMRLLVEAGLTPEEALRSATFLPAQWLGIEKYIGTIEPGKFADLVLLEGNPMIDIKNTQKIAGVFINGKWLNKTNIGAMLSDLSKRNTAAKDKFDWKTTVNKKR